LAKQSFNDVIVL